MQKRTGGRVSTTNPTWLGAMLEGFSLVEQIADGRFTEVYRGRSFDKGRRVDNIFKVAKKPAAIQLEPTKLFDTLALEVTPESTRNVRPNANQLVRYQQQLMTGQLRTEMVVASMLSDVGGSWFYTMPDAGENLRAEFRTRAKLLLFTQLAHLFNRLENKSKFHGDLKPENILWTIDGPLLIDPGFFGLLDCEEGELLKLAITTPAYYPFLSPDDSFAMGLMLWEAVCGFHPLVSRSEYKNATGFSTPITADTAHGESADVVETEYKSEVGESVKTWVSLMDPSCRPFVEPLLKLPRPTTVRPEIPVELEAVVLKGLRLHVADSGLIEKGDGFMTWEDWLADLKALSDLPFEKTSGIHFF